MKLQLSLLTFCAITIGSQVAQTEIIKEQITKAAEVRVVQSEQPKVITEQFTKDVLLKELEEEEAKTKAFSKPISEKVTVKANETVAETVKPADNMNSVADVTIKFGEIKNEAVIDGDVKADAVKEGEVKSDVTKDITVKEEEVKEVTEKNEEIVEPGLLRKIESRIKSFIAQCVKLKIKTGVMIHNIVKWFKAQKYTPKTIKEWISTTVVGAAFTAMIWKGLQYAGVFKKDNSYRYFLRDTHAPRYLYSKPRQYNINCCSATIMN